MPFSEGWKATFLNHLFWVAVFTDHYQVEAGSSDPLVPYLPGEAQRRSARATSAKVWKWHHEQCDLAASQRLTAGNNLDLVPAPKVFGMFLWGLVEQCVDCTVCA